MDLYIIPTYDPRASRVVSPAVRYSRPLEPVVAGDYVPTDLYLIDEAGAYLTSASPAILGAYSLTAAIYSATGEELAYTTGVSVTTTRHQYAYTLPLTSPTLSAALSAGSITGTLVVRLANATGDRSVLYGPLTIMPLVPA